METAHKIKWLSPFYITIEENHWTKSSIHSKTLILTIANAEFQLKIRILLSNNLTIQKL
jgi:outer membrane protease